jgi:hypothetical protein
MMMYIRFVERSSQRDLIIAEQQYPRNIHLYLNLFVNQIEQQSLNNMKLFISKNFHDMILDQIGSV